MTNNEKKIELIRALDEFCSKYKVKASLSFNKHYKISKKNEVFSIVLKESELDYQDIEPLKWHLYSTLFLIKDGRFPNNKVKLTFFLFPIFIFGLSHFLISLTKYVSPEDLSTVSVFSTIVVVNLFLAYWSRKKMKESDLKASNELCVNDGVDYLLKEMNQSKELNLLVADSGMFYFVFCFSNYPSFIDRVRNLSNLKS